LVPNSRSTIRILRRIAPLPLLFILELLVISVWLDTASLSRAAGLAWLIGRWGAWSLRFVVVFAVLVPLLSYLKKRTGSVRISTRLLTIPFAWRFLAGHFCALGTFVFLSTRVFGANLSGLPSDLAAGAWLATGTVAIALAALAFAPAALWLEAARTTGIVWAYALAGALFSCLLGNASRLLWDPAAHGTFFLAKTILQPFLPVVVSDPARYILGTPAFRVEIARQCSGLEGAGLMLVFGAVWLSLFHREFRFPRALLLVPAGISVLYLLNGVRIAALILIGNAGAPGIAMGGFHSQAGWIAFIAVAAGIALAAQHMPWLTVNPTAKSAAEGPVENPTAAYLAPFLAILAAAMVARAASGTVEWLYPLRFFAAAAVLWFYRRRYARLDWKFGWAAAAAGAVVFAAWIGFDWAAGSPAASDLATGLRAWSPAGRDLWLFFRTMAAVTTVPIAEELTFRGFLIRRLTAADFESVDPRGFGWIPALVSSVAFGLLHGSRWPAGILAGIVYAGAMRRRGRIGDAVIAHAATNALLAAWVLIGGHWSDW
jgi:exosortase E/protease (VPEID-CTERM system)